MYHAKVLFSFLFFHAHNQLSNVAQTTGIPTVKRRSLFAIVLTARFFFKGTLSAEDFQMLIQNNHGWLKKNFFLHCWINLMVRNMFHIAFFYFTVYLVKPIQKIRGSMLTGEQTAGVDKMERVVLCERTWPINAIVIFSVPRVRWRSKHATLLRTTEEFSKSSVPAVQNGHVSICKYFTAHSGFLLFRLKCLECLWSLLTCILSLKYCAQVSSAVCLLPSFTASRRRFSISVLG